MLRRVAPEYVLEKEQIFLLNFRRAFEESVGLQQGEGLAVAPVGSLDILLIELAADIGDAASGIRTAFDLTSTASGLEIEDITSHDLLLSVRFALGGQPAPMPVAFK